MCVELRISSLAKRIYSRKYGCGLARFTHRSNNILHSSTVGDGITCIHRSRSDELDVIRYLSVHDNKYLQYFRGHTGRFVPYILYLYIIE